MRPYRGETLRYYPIRNSNQIIIRVNKKIGAIEKQVYNGALDEQMKKKGWKVEEPKGKRLFKNK